MICKRCKKQLKKQGRHTSRTCLGVLSKTAPFAFPDPEDSWARVELWRWQYGTLPSADDMRPLDVSKGLIGLAAGLMNANPVNVAGVLVYAAKLIRQNTATTEDPARWRRCEWAEAQQHRSRILTGSIGLEGAWSEWTDGRPEKTAMNREYEYRTANASGEGRT